MAAETTTGIPIGEVAGVASTQRHRSLGELVAINMFWFALNFHGTALLFLIIPSQVLGLLFREAPGTTIAQRAAWLTDARSALAIALVTAPGLIVALLANPFFGLLSDQTRSQFGRRRPYILGGTLLNVVGLAITALAPDLFIQGRGGNVFAPSLFLLMSGLLVVQLANNAAAAPFHALLPDMVPVGQRGLASGIMGLGFWLGTFSGFLVPTLIGINVDSLKNGTLSYPDFHQSIVLGYGVTAAIMLVMATLTTIFVHETPWQPGQAATRGQADAINASRVLVLTLFAIVGVIGVAFALFTAHVGLTLDKDSLPILELSAVLVAGYGAARAFEFRPRRNPDFTWVVVTRMAVMMGYYTISNFLLLYMESIHAQPDANTGTTIFGLLLIATATLSTFIAGWASDRVGRKLIVYISGFFMAIVGAVVIFALYAAPNAAFSITLAAGVIFGLGIGAYISVDWALVADVLPSEATFARDMGIWNIALTLPQVLALVLGSMLLGLGAPLGSPRLGFTFLFTSFVFFCVLGTGAVYFIRGVKR